MRRISDYVRKNPRVLFFLYLPVYVAWFVLLEHRTGLDGYVCHIHLDDLIPYVPGFIVVYVLWYPYLAYPALVLYFKDAKAFVRFGVYFVVSFSVCMFVCTVFPNEQDLRPLDPGKGFFSWLVARIYQADTNTNVLPSMHVVGCAGAVFAAYDSACLAKLRIPYLALGVLIILSTMFVKQHSALDVFWGLAVAGAVGLPVYLKRLSGIGTNYPKQAS